MARIIAIIKPTKKNKSIMLKRGLFSNDSWFVFDLHASMYDNKPYTIEDTLENKWMFDIILDLGISF